jgi:uncharacterized protein
MNPKFSIEHLDLGEDSTSRPYKARVLKLKSSVAGPRVLFTASVHGAEVQGNAVIWQLLKELSTLPFKGEIIFIPLANPRATTTKIGTMTLGRFNPVTGDNWNRLYVDLTKNTIEVDQFVQRHQHLDNQKLISEYKSWLKQKVIALQKERSLYGENENGQLHLKLQEIGVESDFIFDLHTGPRATEYLYVPEYAKLASRNLKFAHQLIVPHVFAGAFDEASFMPWVRLQNCLNQLGRQFEIPVEAYTVELGSEELICSKLAISQAQKILAYLSQKAILDTPFELDQTQLYQAPLSHYKTYYSPRGGLVEYCIPPGQAFEKGDCLARLLSFDPLDKLANLDQCWSELHALNAGICINHYPSSVVGQGHELLQVLENPTPI